MALSEAAELLDEHGQQLWVLAVAAYGLGDTATTLYGLTRAGTPLAEAGPLASLAFQTHGVVAIVPLKLAVFAFAALFWRFTPRPQAIGIPLALAVFGVLLTCWNTAIILVS